MSGLEKNSEEGLGGREGLCREKIRGPGAHGGGHGWCLVLRQEQAHLCSGSARGPGQLEQGHRREHNWVMRAEGSQKAGLPKVL